MNAKEEYNKKVGERVYNARKRRKELSQDKLAILLNCKQAWVSMVESGKRPLSTEDAKRIAKICNVRYEYLLCIDDFPTIEEYVAHNVKFISEFENGLTALTASVSRRIVDSFSEEISSSPSVGKIYHFDYRGTNIDVNENEMDTIHRDLIDYFEFRLQKLLDSKRSIMLLEQGVASEIAKLKEER